MGSPGGLSEEAQRVFWGQLPLSSSVSDLAFPPLLSALFLVLFFQYKKSSIVFLNTKFHALCKKIRQYKSVKANVKITHNLTSPSHSEMDLMTFWCVAMQTCSIFARLYKLDSVWTSHVTGDHSGLSAISIDPLCHLTCCMGFQFWMDHCLGRSY